MAKNFIDNLSEETKKGLYQKAESGIFPGLAPVGYINAPDPQNPDRRVILQDKERAPIVKSLFEMYSTGQYSLQELLDEAHTLGLRSRKGKKLHRSRMEKLLKDIFYYGDFVWSAQVYPGKHKPIITKELFKQVQKVMKNHSNFKTRSLQRRNLAFTTILTCGECGCAITGEMKRKKKNKPVYYHCTNYYKKCSQGKKYYREEAIEKLFEELIEESYIDDERLELIREGLKQSHVDQRTYVDSQIAVLNKRQQLLRNRLENLYLDKIDDKISEEFYGEKRRAWECERKEIEHQLVALRKAETNYYDVGLKYLEVTQKLRGYWNGVDNRLKRGELIKAILSNCKINDGKLEPTYRKPFDIILLGLKSEKWGHRLDDIRTYFLTAA